MIPFYFASPSSAVLEKWNAHKMAYGYRARGFRSRGYGRRPGRRYMYRAPVRRVRRNYVPAAAFTKRKTYYNRTRPGRTLKRKCTGLVRKTRPYVEKADPANPLVFVRTPKRGWVAMTIVPASAPVTKRMRFFRVSAIRQMARFGRSRAAMSEADFLAQDQTTANTVAAQVTAAMNPPAAAT